MTGKYDVVVVGAGLCGSRIARTCFEFGLNVCVLEKSRGVGGRMATRYHEGLRFDHGAQFFTASDPGFLDYIHSQLGSSVQVWWTDSAKPVYRGLGGMNQLSKSLLEGIFVETQSMVVGVESQSGGWRVEIADGRSWECTHLALTAPVPQSLKLLEPWSDDPTWKELSSVTYRRCVAVLVVSEVPLSLGDYGITRLPQRGIATLTDNSIKGVCSHEGAVLTVHFDSENSDRLWGLADEDVKEETLVRLRRVFEVVPSHLSVHRWRYSEPLKALSGRYREIRVGQSYCQIGGDVFGGAKVESAYLSGAAVGYRILDLISQKGERII